MKYYTIKQLAEILKVGESTVRYWRDKFSDFIPYTGTGRKKRYPEEAAEVLRLIAEYSERSMTAEETQEALRLDFPINHVIQQEPQRRAAAAQQLPSPTVEITPAVVERIDRFLNAFERIADALEKMVDQEATKPPLVQAEKKPPQKPTPTSTPNRKKVMQLMKKLHNQDKNYREIADHLNEKGIPTFSGRGKWQQGTVGKMLKKEPQE